MGLRLPALILTLATATLGYRLSQTVLPISYEVYLNLTEDTFTASSDVYSGYEYIVVRTQEITNQIQIHGAHDFINITTAQIGDVPVASITYDNTTDIITFGLTSNQAADLNLTLYIEFTSRVSTSDMYGFYKSSYTYNDTTKYLVTTQFQPVYARRAFPCFDEPALKATFEIYITHPSGMNALSNMPANGTEILEDGTNLATTYFPTSGVMPSYLVAFIVSEFTCSEGVNVETGLVPHRICSRDETNQTRDFAVSTGPLLLRSLNNFTDLLYSTMGFPKVDQVAIPDFAAGAMENWGLVTYREQYLLWDPTESTNTDQQQIATIISHEFAHMWWGNLVTNQWWSELFLNEGFATYFEYFTTHDVFPKWELDKQFVVRVLQRVLESDSLISSQPLQSPANSDAQIMSRFSQVSYLKGGSIFRMVEHVMGRENFIAGLRTYLSTNAFGNTLPENLWEALHAQLTANNATERLPENTNLTQVMENWVVTPGYPLIDVRWVSTAVIISQEGRFLLNEENNSSRWYVPISYTTNANPNFDNTSALDWLLPIGFIEVPFLTSSGWVILNNHATGFYRVNYNNLWGNVIAALQAQEFSGIPELNRASIVDDAFHLARSNRLNYTSLFNIIQFLRNDTSHHSWFPALSGFNFLLRRVGRNTQLGRAIANYQLDLLSNIYATVPWTNLNENNHAYTLKQVDILNAACSRGLEVCTNHAIERFGEFKISGIRPSKNVRSIVYCNALRYGSTADWVYLWDAYHTTELASEKVRILTALGCSEDENLLNYYITLTLDDTSGIRPQDALTVFTAIYSGSDVGVNVAFRFLQLFHTTIESRFQSLNALSSMITGLAERFTTQSQVEELRTFISNGELHEDFRIAATSALATAEANQLWLNQSWVELHEYFELDPNAPDPENTTIPAGTTLPADGTTPPADGSTPPPPTTTTPGGAATIATSVCLIVLSVLLALS